MTFGQVCPAKTVHPLSLHWSLWMNTYLVPRQWRLSRPEIIKLFSCLSHLSMKISLLINMKMPVIVGIFIVISREIFMLSCV